jgi:integrase
LRWDAVVRAGREIRLRTSKNGHGRVLPLEGALWDLIEQRWAAREIKQPDGVTRLAECVFHRDGRPIVDFKKPWGHACREAGVSGKLFHDLRRTAVRNMIRAGVPQAVAMSISGHRTVSMFLRYNIASDDDKRDALRKTQAHVGAQPAQPTVVRMGAASRPS